MTNNRLFATLDDFYTQLTDEEIVIYEATHQPDWLLDWLFDAEEENNG